MNQIMKIKSILLVCALLLGGCAEVKQYSPESDLLEPNVTNYLLSCLNDTQGIGPKEFVANFKMAEDGLQSGRDFDKLRYICLSLHTKADYNQFKQGSNVLEQYIAEHPDSPDDIQGFKILVDWLDEELMNKWSAWKLLLKDKEELTAEVESLRGRIGEDQILIGELQKQIEQLKNIENIIKSRESVQP